MEDWHKNGRANQLHGLYSFVVGNPATTKMEEQMSKLLINENPLVFQPTIAKLIGLQEAIVLQQVQYWLSNPNVGVYKNGHKWVHNSYAEWAKNLPFWSESYIKKIILKLERMGLLISAQFAPNPYDHTKAYRIDEKALEKLTDGTLEEQPFVPYGDNLSETTSETTSNSMELTKKPSIPPANLPVEWIIASGNKVTQLQDKNLAGMIDAANTIATGTGSMSKEVYELALTFMKERNIIIPDSKYKGNRSKAKELVKMGVKPIHISQAVKILTDKKYTCVDLFSIDKEAVNAANPTANSNLSTMFST